jgi:hypothetical protein
VFDNKLRGKNILNIKAIKPDPKPVKRKVDNMQAVITNRTDASGSPCV